LPELKMLATTEVVQVGPFSSTSLRPQQVLDWSTAVDEALKRPEVVGAVVLQGTNTLEESAYLFDLTIESKKPVVLTGAMRAPGEEGFDGGRNLLASVAVAAHGEAGGLGTLVVMNDEIHAAGEVEKTHTTAVDAFSSPRLGPIGMVHGDETTVSIVRKPVRGARISTTTIDPRVALLTCCLGAEGLLVSAAIEAEIHGLVVAALGMGDVPPEMAHELSRAVEHGIPVVVARRAAAGYVEPRYASEGDGRWLADRGIDFAGGLSATKARVGLMLDLGARRQAPTIAASSDNCV
jgi:L-asparaginase